MRAKRIKWSYHTEQYREEVISFMSKSITQDMAYRQSLMKYTENYGVSPASRKYNKGRSYIYFWKPLWGGSVESLACQSRRPESLFCVMRKLGMFPEKKDLRSQALWADSLSRRAHPGGCESGSPQLTDETSPLAFSPYSSSNLFDKPTNEGVWGIRQWGASAPVL